MSEATEFEGRVAIVTGAGRGIGAETATLLATRGATVALFDRIAQGMSDVADAIGAAGGHAQAFVCDVSDEHQVQRAFDEVVTAFGTTADVLVANHTIHACGPVLETSYAEWDLSLAINLAGTFLCVRAALPGMIEKGRGAIAALGSDCVIRSCRSSAAYMASKAGMVGLMRSVAIDYAKDGIRANVVVPGATDTEGLHQVFTERGDFEASVDRAAKQSPFGRLGRPRDVAEMIAFACSDRASFVTGTELLVEGGMTLAYSAD